MTGQTQVLQTMIGRVPYLDMVKVCTLWAFEG